MISMANMITVVQLAMSDVGMNDNPKCVFLYIIKNIINIFGVGAEISASVHILFCV